MSNPVIPISLKSFHLFSTTILILLSGLVNLKKTIDSSSSTFHSIFNWDSQKSPFKNWLFYTQLFLRQEEKGMTEDKTVGWNHQLNRHEFEQAWGVGDGQGDLVCCSPCGHKESDTT